MRAESAEELVRRGLDGSDGVEVFAGGSGDERAEEHHPDAAEGAAPERPAEGSARGARRKVAGVVGDVDGPGNLVAGRDAQLGQERHQMEVAEVERAGREVELVSAAMVSSASMTMVRYVR